MSQQQPDPALAGAGLSATGTTADQMAPGQPTPGTTYSDPGGTGTADEEVDGDDKVVRGDADRGEDAAATPG